MKSLDKNLAFLFVVMMVLLLAMFYCEHYFPMDGQIFQVIAGLLTMSGTIFFQAARHTFGIPDPPEGTTKILSETVVSKKKPDPTPPTLLTEEKPNV